VSLAPNSDNENDIEEGEDVLGLLNPPRINFVNSYL